MALNQVIGNVKTGVCYVANNGYVGLFAGGSQFPPFQRIEYTENIIPAVGTFSKLYVKATPGSNGLSPVGFTLTLYKNGSPTGITVTVPPGGALTTDLVNTVSVSEFDTVTYYIQGTGQVSFGFYVQVAIQFTGADDISSFYGAYLGGVVINPVGSGAIQGALGNGYPESFTDGLTTSSGSYSIATVAGNLKKLTVKSYTDSNWIAVIYKNGVKQDGSGGTVDTRVSPSGMSLTGSSTFTLPVAVKDVLNVAYYRINTSAPSSQVKGLVCSVQFQSSTDFNYMFCGGSNNALFDVGTNYLWINTEQLATGEDQAKTPLCSTVRVLGFYGRVEGPPGADSSFVYTLRKNSTDTDIAFTIADTDDEGQDTGDVSFTAGDFIDLSYQAINSPETHQFHWGMALSSEDSPVESEGGIYKMVPGKTDDTIYTDFDPVTTEHVKIPDPFVTSGLIGDE